MAEKHSLNLACSSLLVGPRRKKTDRGQRSASPSRNLLVRAFDYRAQGFNFPLACRRSICPPLSLNMARTYPMIERCCDLPGIPRRQSPLSLACHCLLKGPNWSSEEAHLVDTILKLPYPRGVSIDRLSREDSQLAASLEGESSPTPVGKTLPQLILQNQVLCVCVFSPIHSGHQVRWAYQPGSHRRKVTHDFLSTFLLRWVL